MIIQLPFMIRFCFFWLFSLLSLSVLLCQTTFTLPIENCGESITRVKAIASDANGHLWYATSCGLVYETGNYKRLFPYEKDDNFQVDFNSVQNPSVSRLIISSRNHIWVNFGDVPAAYQFNIDTKSRSCKSFKTHQKSEHLSLFHLSVSLILYTQLQRYGEAMSITSTRCFQLWKAEQQRRLIQILFMWMQVSGKIVHNKLPTMLLS